MRRITVLAVSLSVIAAGLFVSSSRTRGQVSRAIVGARCLHDVEESQPDRVRREQALSLARAINAAEGRAIEQSRRYQPMQQLGTLPDAPAGFVVRLYTDGEGYMLSIKDDRDACRYVIFSDQHGTVYEASLRAPLVAT